MPEQALRLEGVSKRFGAAVAVDRVSLDVPAGAFATLLGPSGCGKTTTLRLVAGFHDPDQGAILLGGRRIDRLPAHRRGTAMVFQDYALFPHMTVRDNVAYGLRLARVRRSERERRVDATLAFTDLEGLGGRYPGQLSGGQQQRVALARALVIEPQVLLLDEPLSNLDARLRERLRWELRALQQRLGMTFVYVTHDQEEALSMSDWVAVMRDGRIEQVGAPDEIYRRPRTPFVAGFVGAANLVPAAELAAFGFEVPPGRLVCVRPETVRLDGPGPGEVQLRGEVRRSAFLGALRRYWVEVDGREWIVDEPAPDPRPRTGAVELGLDPRRAHVIEEEDIT